MRAIAAFTLAFSMAVLAVSPGEAQQAGVETRIPCHSYAEIARQLDNRYKESPVSLGVQTNGNLLQVFASPESGTWTILSTSPTGTTCVIAAGKSWESLKISNDPEA
ncbi:MAG TPA: hypothetical protein PKA13_18340 [Geminicoccaceae bacterium]|nr:hypothetical protein [Geminicoccus sp.]HMU51741.1 hypothetical protein [Geminicoccaceae bacterium]